MYRDTFFKSRVILNTCTIDTHLCVARHWKKVFRYTIYVLRVTKKKLQYTIFVSVIPQFCTGGTHLCVVCYKKIVLTSSAIHKFCISDTPNQRIPKKSRPVMIHPPDTHQSIDTYIIHVPPSLIISISCDTASEAIHDYRIKRYRSCVFI